MNTFIKTVFWGIQVYICQALATGFSYFIVNKINKLFEIHEFFYLLFRFSITIILILLLCRFWLSTSWKFDFPKDILSSFNVKKFIIFTFLGLLLAFGYFVFLWLFSPNKSISFNKNISYEAIFYIIFQGIFAATMGSFTEEFLYRGYYQQALLKYTNNTAQSIITPAFFFGLSHWFSADTVWLSFLYVLRTFLKGIIYGLFARFTGSFWYSAAVHYGWNILFISSVIDVDCKSETNNFVLKTFIDCNNLLTLDFYSKPLPSGLFIYYFLILFFGYLLYKKNSKIWNTV
ncbi:CPBP family intramembrane glutamic endopeptidase [Runella sp.]|jgi:hypothetical protein|uniref:CPBP family intramembrane glutamic endopeptidase n=1 Tax=Runella sp. TaxID=1960881 RepID=UPI00262486EA|nr:CPBP family intramembrane glutamic endopeptidase [Runella sp.]